MIDKEKKDLLRQFSLLKKLFDFMLYIFVVSFSFW